MDDTKITRQRDRWTGQLNGRHGKNSPKRWMDGTKEKLTKGWRIKWSARK